MAYICHLTRSDETKKIGYCIPMVTSLNTQRRRKKRKTKHVMEWNKKEEREGQTLRIKLSLVQEINVTDKRKMLTTMSHIKKI